MFRPEDLIQDELEYPEQTQQLQMSYPISQADQQSLQRIRMRLAAQRAAASSIAQIEDLPKEHSIRTFNVPLERPSVGQFLPPSPRPKKKAVSNWYLVALVAVLCLVLFSGTWYAWMSMGHSKQLEGTPTTQKPVSYTLFNINMISATTGWAIKIDSHSLSGREMLTVVRTTDGGKTWPSRNLHDPSIDVVGSLFLNDRTAWIKVGMKVGSSFGPHTVVKVEHTTDAGQSWQAIYLPAGTDHFEFVDQQHGWAFTSFPPSPIQEANPLYKTDDGGTHWTRSGTMSRTRNFDDQMPGPLPYGGGFSFSFSTPQRGWAAVFMHDSFQHAYLYMTRDGGMTWQLQHLPQPTSGPIPGIHTTIQGGDATGAFVQILPPTFFTPKYGILDVMSQAAAQKPREIYMYETNDGGDTWKPLGTRIEDRSRSLYLKPVIDATHLALTGRQTFTMYALVNARWQQQSTLHFEGDLMALAFRTSQSGWALTSQLTNGKYNDTLYTTSDGGQSWHSILRMSTPQPPH